MPQGHGIKDLDDFILAVIRTPAFLAKVNDIVVECGNSLYQPVLDRYIAGEDVPFAEVQKVWRNTTQLPCGISGMFEQFFPLISHWILITEKNCSFEKLSREFLSWQDRNNPRKNSIRGLWLLPATLCL